MMLSCRPGVVPILRAMLLHPAEPPHAVAAAAALGALAADNPQCAAMVGEGGVTSALVRLITTAPLAQVSVAVKALTNMTSQSPDLQHEVRVAVNTTCGATRLHVLTILLTC